MILFEEFGDLLAQIPVTLIMMICGSFLLLIAAFSWFAFIKPSRQKSENRRRETEAPPVSTLSPAPAYDPADMPDLDMLVARDESESPPTPTIQPAQAEQPLQPEQPTPSINEEPAFLHDQPITKGYKYHVPLNDGDAIETEELVSVLRDPRDGRLVVFLDGMGYRTLVDTPDAKKKFVGIMRELSDVVTKPDPRQAEQAEQAQPIAPETDTTKPVESGVAVDMPAPVDSTAGDPASVDTTEPPQESVITAPDNPEPEPPLRKTTPPPPINTEGMMPGDIPSFKLDDTAPQASGKDFLGRTKYEFEPVEELDIPGRIEAYLQHKLRHTPEYAGRDIHVRSAPGGLVRIQVDDKFFDAVGDVDEPDIRQFLSETIQEWQDRN